MTGVHQGDVVSDEDLESARLGYASSGLVSESALPPGGSAVSDTESGTPLEYLESVSKEFTMNVDTPAKRQRAYYADTADRYEADHVHDGDEHYFALQHIAFYLKWIDAHSVLDTGCGTGRATDFSVDLFRMPPSGGMIRPRSSWQLPFEIMVFQRMRSIAARVRGSRMGTRPSMQLSRQGFSTTSPSRRR